MKGDDQLAPIVVALALSCSRIQRFEDLVFDFLKVGPGLFVSSFDFQNRIRDNFADQKRESLSQWVRETLPHDATLSQCIMVVALSGYLCSFARRPSRTAFMAGTMRPMVLCFLASVLRMLLMLIRLPITC
jgi:hypothetical protein